MTGGRPTGVAATLPRFDTGAACARRDPELFFPIETDAAAVEKAKAVCRTCPSVRACLAYALANEVQGVWGATTATDRTELRRRHGLQPAPVQMPVDEPIHIEAGGGLSAAEAAERLGVTPRTIVRYRKQLRAETPMTTNALAEALAGGLAHIDDMTPVLVDDEPESYITALRAGQLFADRTYQRDLNELRVERMASGLRVPLLGVLEVSERADGRYAIVDGQHRWAAVIEGHPLHEDAALVCNVHTRLTVEDEARLFYDIDAQRRMLSGWDRWKARRSSGDPEVRAIEETVARHELQVGMGAQGGLISATKALEQVAELGGTQLLDETLGVVVAAFGRTTDALTGSLFHGVAQVLAHYDRDELDVMRLIEAMQGLAPRQLLARAGALREIHKGQLPRLVGVVLVERYNGTRGRKLEDFITRVPPISKSKTAGSNSRQLFLIRAWARRVGLSCPPAGRIPKAVKDAYYADHPKGTTE